MSATTPESTSIINGIDAEAVRELIAQVADSPARGMTNWRVSTRWCGGARTETRSTGFGMGGAEIQRDFTIPIDEPQELGGTNRHANPQEVLLAGMNACIAVTYVTLCALEGIQLEELRIETEGDIDLRGLFALDDQTPPGYESIRYQVHLKGDATPDQFRAVHEKVCASSPNFYNLANAVRLEPELVVE